MTDDAIARLRTTGEHLPPALRDEILAMGTAAVPALIDALAIDDWACLHAAMLLIDLRATEAVQPLLDVMVEDDPDGVLANDITVRLGELGAPVVEPALAMLADADEDDEGALCEILVKSGVKDERIFAALRDLFLEDILWPGLLAQYGDSRALPLVDEALSAFRPDFSDISSRIEMNELVDAYERLGGVLTPERRATIDGWRAGWQSRGRPARSAKVGRNEPCPCGSGKKYKKCCVDKRDAAPEGSADDDSGGGWAAEIMEYARPLLDASDGSDASIQRSMDYAMVFWNLATIANDAERAAKVDAIASKFEGRERASFEQAARMMIDRHRTMFPGLHRRAG